MTKQELLNHKKNADAMFLPHDIPILTLYRIRQKRCDRVTISQWAQIRPTVHVVSWLTFLDPIQQDLFLASRGRGTIQLRKESAKNSKPVKNSSDKNLPPSNVQFCRTIGGKSRDHTLCDPANWPDQPVGQELVNIREFMVFFRCDECHKENFDKLPVDHKTRAAFFGFALVALKILYLNRIRIFSGYPPLQKHSNQGNTVGLLKLSSEFNSLIQEWTEWQNNSSYEHSSNEEKLKIIKEMISKLWTDKHVEICSTQHDYVRQLCGVASPYFSKEWIELLNQRPEKIPDPPLLVTISPVKSNDITDFTTDQNMVYATLNPYTTSTQINDATLNIPVSQVTPSPTPPPMPEITITSDIYSSFHSSDSESFTNKRTKTYLDGQEALHRFAKANNPSEFIIPSIVTDLFSKSYFAEFDEKVQKIAKSIEYLDTACSSMQLKNAAYKNKQQRRIANFGHLATANAPDKIEIANSKFRVALRREEKIKEIASKLKVHKNEQIQRAAMMREIVLKHELKCIKLIHDQCNSDLDTHSKTAETYILDTINYLTMCKGHLFKTPPTNQTPNIEISETLLKLYREIYDYHIENMAAKLRKVSSMFEQDFMKHWPARKILNDLGNTLDKAENSDHEQTSLLFKEMLSKIAAWQGVQENIGETIFSYNPGPFSLIRAQDPDFQPKPITHDESWNMLKNTMGVLFKFDHKTTDVNDPFPVAIASQKTDSIAQNSVSESSFDAEMRRGLQASPIIVTNKIIRRRCSTREDKSETSENAPEKALKSPKKSDNEVFDKENIAPKAQTIAKSKPKAPKSISLKSRDPFNETIGARELAAILASSINDKSVSSNPEEKSLTKAEKSVPECDL